MQRRLDPDAYHQGPRNQVFCTSFGQTDAFFCRRETNSDQSYPYDFKGTVRSELAHFDFDMISCPTCGTCAVQRSCLLFLVFVPKKPSGGPAAQILWGRASSLGKLEGYNTGISMATGVPSLNYDWFVARVRLGILRVWLTIFDRRPVPFARPACFARPPSSLGLAPPPFAPPSALRRPSRTGEFVPSPSALRPGMDGEAECSAHRGSSGAGGRRGGRRSEGRRQSGT